jgi:hypothetical protein
MASKASSFLSLPFNASLTITYTNNSVKHSLEMPEWNTLLMADAWLKSKQSLDQNVNLQL